ncbi:hypothetical protein FJTKL_12337 [Diaporthe vaccinii]|uniref:Oligopeptide transporter n=1 Tax=Diaporthe vaccinii TaxID=105482 RepID=A0ABR4EEF2_9PEZI
MSQRGSHSTALQFHFKTLSKTRTNLGTRSDLGCLASASAATAVVNGYFCFQTIMLLAGAVAADGWMGRYKLPVICSLTYMLGNIILVAISTPVAIEADAAPAGFVISLILIAIGSGGFQSVVSAFIGDQYIGSKQSIITRKDGTVYMPDKDLTLQYIYNLNYWYGFGHTVRLNLGSISGVATTFLELHYGFWAAFLLPLCGLWIAPAALIIGHKAFIRTTPKESALLNKSKAFARLAKQRMRSKPNTSEADDSAEDVEDMESLQKVLEICRVLLMFIVIWVCVGQMTSNFIAQAGQMQTNGLPNDLTWFANRIMVVLLMPIVQWFLTSVAGRYHIPFGPMARITVGCVFLALAMAYQAVMQKLIYSAAPCYEYPTQCAASGGGGPNDISVWLQLPSYFLIGLSEVLAVSTGYKYAYSAAPESMKSLVQAIFLLSAGAGALICLAIAPTARNPNLVVMWACIAGTMFLATVIFAAVYWKKDRRIRLEGAEPVDQGVIGPAADPEEKRVPDKAP